MPTVKQRKTIQRIRIVAKFDESPDTSDLGKYSDNCDEWSICRRDGDYVHNLRLQAKRDSLPEAKQELAKQLEKYYPDAKDLRYSSDEDAIESGELEVCGIDPEDGAEFSLYQTLEGWNPPERSREYRYFKPYAGGEKDGTPDYQTNGMQDYNRMESLCNGDWHYCVVCAIADVSIGESSQEIRSNGCWGVESDCGDYLKDVAHEEMYELRDILRELGFSQRAIKQATPTDLTPDFI